MLCTLLLIPSTRSPSYAHAGLQPCSADVRAVLIHFVVEEWSGRLVRWFWKWRFGEALHGLRGNKGISRRDWNVRTVGELSSARMRYPDGTSPGPVSTYTAGPRELRWGSTGATVGYGRAHAPRRRSSRRRVRGAGKTILRFSSARPEAKETLGDYAPN